MNTTRQRPDDQYVMPVEASRRGAHRARVNPLLGALPIVAVAVVVAGVVLLAWTLFGGAGDATQSAGAVSTASPSASGEVSPSAEPSPSASAAEPTPEPSDGATPEPTPEPTPESVVDKSQPVVVRNSTGTGGLARGAAARLEEAGWTINGIPDNFRPTIDSTVFFATDEQRANARAVAKVLGIDLVKKNASRAEKGVTVILGPDYSSR